MKLDPEQAAEAVVKIRKLLAEWLLASAESRQSVGEILRLLEPVDAFIRGEIGRSPDDQKPERARRGDKTTYSIDKKKNEVETLVEHREGGTSQPYRVPKYIYEAVGEVLSKSVEPLDFESVVKSIGKNKMNPPGWQVRAALRFMLNATPPLIVRERRKYRPMRREKFVAEAKTAWQSLAKASKGQGVD